MNTRTHSGLLPIALVILLAACAEQDNTPKSENAAEDGAATGMPPSASATPAMETVVAPAQPATTAVVSDPNPAHGAPGHRCEIPVGASLSSAPPAGATPAPMPPAGPPVTMNTSQMPTTTAPGMNPPHGQPGHDCNVAVGSPLPK